MLHFIVNKIRTDFILITLCCVLLTSLVKVIIFSNENNSITKDFPEYIKGFIYKSAWNKENQFVFISENSEHMILYCNYLSENIIKEFERGAYVRIKIDSCINFPQKAVNPGGFDQREYLAGRNINYIVTPRDSDIELQRNSDISFLLLLKTYYLSFFAKIRNSISTSLSNSLGSRHSAVAMAVLTGDTGGIEADDMQSYRDAGIAHIMAVSGMHVGFVSSIIAKIVSRRKIGFSARNIFQIIFLLCFACIADFSPSVTRAFLQSAYCFVAKILRRPGKTKNGLCFACILQLIQNPYVLFSSGFILSYIATASVLIIKPVLSKKIFFFGKITSEICTGTSVNLGMFPLLVNYFNSFSPVGILASIFAGKIAYWICMWGFSVWIIDFLPLGNFILKIPAALLACSLTVLEQVSKVGSSIRSPIGAFNVPSFSTYTVILYYVILFLIINKKSLRIIKKYFAFFILIGAVITVGQKFIYRPTEILFFDVGQGACAFIKTSRVCGLIDGGDGKTDVSSLLFKQGVGTLDFITVTHGHSDHTGGIYNVIEEHRVKCIFVPDNPYDSGVADICKKAEEKGIEIIRISGLHEYTTGDLYLRMCTNVETMNSEESSDINNSSVVVFAENSDGSVLFTGDIEEETESLFVDKKWIAESDVLYVAHHGSDTSSYMKNISKISPEYAIISVGYRNNYGHPSESVIETLEKVGSQIRRNDMCGAIKITMRKEKLQAWQKLTISNT